MLVVFYLYDTLCIQSEREEPLLVTSKQSQIRLRLDRTVDWFLSFAYSKNWRVDVYHSDGSTGSKPS